MVRISVGHRDRKRWFGAAQRKVLFKRADGKCQDCGDVLRPGWQADHVVPWSHGGPTVLSNGRALCPYCNLARSDLESAGLQAQQAIAPRGWQLDLLEAWRSRKGPIVAASVAPGAGKTIASAFVAREAKAFVIVVVPSCVIREGFIEAYAKAGLQIEPFSGAGVRNGFHGVIGTYQLFSKVETCAALLTTARARDSRFVVIADEIHHAGDGNLWGAALRDLVESAATALLMSGTPYREDRRRIPGLRYDDDNRGEFDFVYSYEDALLDGYVIPVRFPMQGGSAVWTTADARHEANTQAWEALSGGHRSRLLTRLFSAGSEYMRITLAQADAELLRIRRTRLPQAAGIVFCFEQEDAREVARLLAKTTGESAEVVVSDDPTSHERLAEFRQGGHEAPRWLVTCKMVSEGADVRRLRVAVWATLVRKSRLFFTQLVGRVQRAVPGVHDDHAIVFLPDIPELREFAQSLTDEQAVVGFEQMEAEVPASDAGGRWIEGPRSVTEFVSDDAWKEGEIAGGEVLLPEERAALEAATQDSHAAPSLYARLEAVQRLRRELGARSADEADRYADRLEAGGAEPLCPMDRAELMERLLAEIAAKRGDRR